MTRFEPTLESPRVLVVHEWFAAVGGSENVANAIRQTFIGSDMLCLWREPNAETPGAGEVFESALRRRPFRMRKVLSLPFMPAVWRSTRARSHSAQVAVVSTHLFAHHVAVRSGMHKLLYVHTPARYIWEPELDSRGQGLAIRAIAAILKPLDRLRAAEATDIAANSEFVKARVRAAWARDARVIYPPVEVEEIRNVSDWAEVVDTKDKEILGSLPPQFFLGASRFIPYKRLDLAIRAGELAGVPVVIAGSGPEERSLRERAAAAAVPVHFIIAPSTSLLRALYQRASVFVFPPVEDFGIMPVECMAAGTPVVSNRIGGAGESVLDGLTGAHFDPEDDESLKRALTSALALDRTTISEHVLRFSRQRFETEMRDWVAETVRKVAA